VLATQRRGNMQRGDGEAVGLTASHDQLPVPAVSLVLQGVDPAVAGLLDQVAESVLVACPVTDSLGRLADFTITHLSPGYIDPAGRSPAEIAGLTLLQAYPDGASGDGLFARAAQVLADGRPQQVSGPVGMPRTGPLTGSKDVAQIADLKVAPHGGCVVFTWRGRSAGEDPRLAELLAHVQRLGQLAAWDEDFTTGTVRWTETAFAIFGLDPDKRPIPMSELHHSVVSADRPLLRRFRQSLLRQREPAAAMFRIVRPEDGVIRQIRVFAEPVLANGDVVALRGAFQDVSALYHTQVALAATRDQLATSEQRAAEEHELCVRLQRAIMPSGTLLGKTAAVEIAVRYRPAEAGYLVAGDWYDTLPLPGGDLLLVIGDIAGHGVEAVTGMVAARNALRGLAATDAEPYELLTQLNFAAYLFTEGITGTVLCGRYDPRTRVFRWARAGHLPPVLVRGGVAAVQPMPEGMLLGVDTDVAFEQVTLQLRAGDILLLYTDGLIERRAASISDALAEFAASAVPVDPDLDSYAARILANAGSDTGDDACLLAVRILLRARTGRASQLRVQHDGLRGHGVPAERADRALAPGVAHRRRAGRVAQQRVECLRQRARVVGRDEQPGHAFVDYLGDAAHPGGDDGGAARHRLQVDNAERLVHRRAREHRGVREQLDDVALGQHLRDPCDPGPGCLQAGD
jgi:serine phosphatase RsbU (regulator of sigma subunit)